MGWSFGGIVAGALQGVGSGIQQNLKEEFAAKEAAASDARALARGKELENLRSENDYNKAVRISELSEKKAQATRERTGGLHSATVEALKAEGKLKPNTPEFQLELASRLRDKGEFDISKDYESLGSKGRESDKKLAEARVNAGAAHALAKSNMEYTRQMREAEVSLKDSKALREAIGDATYNTYANPDDPKGKPIPDTSGHAVGLSLAAALKKQNPKLTSDEIAGSIADATSTARLLIKDNPGMLMGEALLTVAKQQADAAEARKINPAAGTTFDSGRGILSNAPSAQGGSFDAGSSGGYGWSNSAPAPTPARTQSRAGQLFGTDGRPVTTVQTGAPALIPTIPDVDFRGAGNINLPRNQR